VYPAWSKRIQLFLDGVYGTDGADRPAFRHVAGPDANDLQGLVEQIAARVGQVLEKRGLIERDIENAWLGAGAEPGPPDDLIGHSIAYRIAVGPRAGQKLFTLQTVAPRLQGLEYAPNGAVRASGFSLHASVDIAANQRPKLERLCRYVSRPAVASERLALSASGQVRYQLKTPYRDGTTHTVLEPLDFMARLAALVPPPRQVAMNWAQRLKRVFGIEIEGCARCAGKLKILASIEEPQVIARILWHLQRTVPEQYPSQLPLGARAPPVQASLL
jgi:hypothetical protein